MVDIYQADSYLTDAFLKIANVEYQDEELHNLCRSTQWKLIDALKAMQEIRNKLEAWKQPTEGDSE